MKKIIVIGGVAAGPKAASRINRLDPDADITIIERGELLSYAGCGLPYYVSGKVSTQEELMSTPAGVVRDPVFFSKVKNVRVLNRTEAVSINPTEKSVCVKGPDGEQTLAYDQLVMATGASPSVPPFDGLALQNIFTLQKIEDAERIRALLAENKAKDIVIVGGGLIGIEMAEAFVECHCRVTIVERLPHILLMLDDEMAENVERYLESNGIKVRTGVTVNAFTGHGQVEQVVTDHGSFAADMVLVSVGVSPNVALAQQAGIKLGDTGAIWVTPQMQTSEPDIYAVGDCAEQQHMVTGRPCYVPLGSTANKQGRVAANSICGKPDQFPGVLGSAVCKIFDYTVARSGLSEKEARAAGYEVETVLSPSPDKPHFYPGSAPIIIKLVVNKINRCLLGIQVVGSGEAEKRVNAAVLAIAKGLTVDELSYTDLCYAPPYSPAIDNLLTAAHIACNKLDGMFESYTPAEVKQLLADGGEPVLLDVRAPHELEWKQVEGAVNIPLGALRTKYEQLPKDREIIAFCKVSLRGYEAALVLKSHGFTNVKVMEGGVMMW